MATGSLTKQKRTRTKPASASYWALIRRFPLRPIQSEAELDAATALIDELIDRAQLDPGEKDYLDVLGDLTMRYEAEHHPMDDRDVSEGDMLRHLMVDAKGVKQVEVARATGIAESTVSEVLAGKRQLTRGQIEKLARYFHVPPGVFFPCGENNGS